MQIRNTVDVPYFWFHLSPFERSYHISKFLANDSQNLVFFSRFCDFYGGMMDQIVARSEEQKTLERLYSSGKAEFLAVYGRRRVGKTFLIRGFFRNKGLYFALTGVKNAQVGKQLRNFTEELSR
jgi:hypothetical protein